MARGNKQEVSSFATSESERNTYRLTSREEKERTPAEEVLQHWDARAQRADVQAVMSARHPLEL